MVAAQNVISFNSPEMFEEIDGKCALADVSNDKQEVIYTFEGDAHNSAWYLEGNVIIAKFSVSSLQDFSCPVATLSDDEEVQAAFGAFKDAETGELNVDWERRTRESSAGH